MVDTKLRELARLIQFGEEEDAARALEEVVEASSAAKENESGRPKTVNTKLIERNRMMDLVSAKHEMEESRARAEGGQGLGIAEFWHYRFPQLLAHGIKDEAVELASEKLAAGAPNAWETYEEAGIETCLAHGLSPDVIMTEDELIHLHGRLHEDEEESPRLITPIKVGETERGSEERLLAQSGVRELAASRGQDPDNLSGRRHRR